MRLTETAVFRGIRQIAQFATGSLTSYASEIGSFALLVKVVFRSEAEILIIVSMIAARALSMVVQYSINRFLVFRSQIRLGVSFPRYVAVNLGLLSVSYLLIYWCRKFLPFDITVIKMSVDLVLFFANYILQRLFVFEYGGAAAGSGLSRRHPMPAALRILSFPQRRRRPETPEEPSSKESEGPGED